MRQYELYLVLDGDVEEQAVSDLIDRVTAMVSAGDGGIGGEVIKVEPRGKRRLAYSIRNKTEGQDIILTFQSPPAVLPEITRALKLNEQVLRYLLVKTDEG